MQPHNVFSRLTYIHAGAETLDRRCVRHSGIKNNNNDHTNTAATNNHNNNKRDHLAIDNEPAIFSRVVLGHIRKGESLAVAAPHSYLSDKMEDDHK